MSTYMVYEDERLGDLHFRWYGGNNVHVMYSDGTESDVWYSLEIPKSKEEFETLAKR